MKIALSFDIEPDLHTNKYLGVTEGIPRILTLLNKHNAKGTFFVTCDCIEKYPEIFQELITNGHEIALHAYRHERFDELSYGEKEEQIKKSIACFKKYLNIKPRGFRAPQCSIDNDTLIMLERYGFSYDSSYAPLNLLQLIFFPEKPGLWIKTFFSRLSPYKIRKNLIEVPHSSFILPFVSMIVRIFPRWTQMLFADFLSLIYNPLVFYAHSWDFIKLKESRIDRTFSHNGFIRNLDYLLGKLKKNNKFVKMENLT